MSDPLHPILVTARLAGSTRHVIRIWEQRARAVEPGRTPLNHRFYSRNDIEWLSLLRDVTHTGYYIGLVAPLTNDKLRAMVEAASGLKAQQPHAATPAGEPEP